MGVTFILGLLWGLNIPSRKVFYAFGVGKKHKIYLDTDHISEVFTQGFIPTCKPPSRLLKQGREQINIHLLYKASTKTGKSCPSMYPIIWEDTVTAALKVA